MNNEYITLKSGTSIKKDRIDAIEPKRHSITHDGMWTGKSEIVGYYVYCSGACISITEDDYNELKEYLK